MEDPAAALTLAFEQFDLATGIRVREVLARAAPGSAFVLDLSQARSCEDAALVVVVDAAARRPSVRCGVRGLGEHQIRLLHYLGVRVAGGEIDARSAEAPGGPGDGRST